MAAEKILIIGNSGSGKSTLANSLSKKNNAAHLDLDMLAWLPTTPPARMPLQESQWAIQKFITEHSSWVIEGCYTDLLEYLTDASTQLIYLDLPVEACIENARLRPWEPQKYPSKKAQDENIEMLISWIRDYDNREDVFSKNAHVNFFNHYPGYKIRYPARPVV